MSSIASNAVILFLAFRLNSKMWLFRKFTSRFKNAAKLDIIRDTNKLQIDSVPHDKTKHGVDVYLKKKSLLLSKVTTKYSIEISLAKTHCRNILINKIASL